PRAKSRRSLPGSAFPGGAWERGNEAGGAFETVRSQAEPGNEVPCSRRSPLEAVTHRGGAFVEGAAPVPPLLLGDPRDPRLAALRTGAERVVALQLMLRRLADPVETAARAAPGEQVALRRPLLLDALGEAPVLLAAARTGAVDVALGFGDLGVGVGGQFVALRRLR